MNIYGQGKKFKLLTGIQKMRFGHGIRLIIIPWMMLILWEIHGGGIIYQPMIGSIQIPFFLMMMIYGNLIYKGTLFRYSLTPDNETRPI